MLVGYNTNISYKGTVYHVQTEDSGTKNPMIITLLYVKGTILASKKSNYSHLISQADYKDSVRELMKEQHKAMIKELIAGKYAEAAPPAEPPAAEPLPEAQTVPSAPQETVSQPAPSPEKPEQKAEGKPDEPSPQASGDDSQKSQISRSLDDILLDYIMKDTQ